MSSYSEKLRDPRWQRRRLEVFERADFTCEHCGDKTESLNAHHRVYRRATDPWDYHSHEIVCLCATCHDQEHAARDKLATALAILNEEEIHTVVGYAAGIAALKGFDFNLLFVSEQIAFGLSDSIDVYWKDIVANWGEHREMTAEEIMKLPRESGP